MFSIKFVRYLMKLPITFFRWRNLSTLWRLSSICFCLCFRTASASAMLCAVSAAYTECFVLVPLIFPGARKIEMLQLENAFMSLQLQQISARSEARAAAPETIYNTDTGEPERSYTFRGRVPFSGRVSSGKVDRKGVGRFLRPFDSGRLPMCLLSWPRFALHQNQAPCA